MDNKLFPGPELLFMEHFIFLNHFPVVEHLEYFQILIIILNF